MEEGSEIVIWGVYINELHGKSEEKKDVGTGGGGRGKVERQWEKKMG